ncbi:DUF982 domain-containing protein [Falsirhodobacter halotolerans]|uniref:DUF982 domain-containing protein n=1 Tax=Falsirhodobacter halotolerans TaxID=1146892 RepID=UPI001FD04307|nr:DUF982 domain-containing protein [Falsirhodobacter halotolerans]MCJ8139326.1 DUF982 domain-containing protein [Falsirhodobacter halotolerans]
MSAWIKPIVFDHGPAGTAVSYESTDDALAALNGDWPTRSGRDYLSAKSMCEAAVKGRECHSRARDAFLFAAEEVGLFPRF